MSNVVLIILSIVLIFSSLSEKIEFIVHNEEVLLTLCFIAFIFFAYSYLSSGFSEDFEKKTVALEEQISSVISEKFKNTITYFNELFWFKNLGSRLLIIENILYFKLASNFQSSQIFEDKINVLTGSILAELIRLESKIIKIIQSKVVESALFSLILPLNSPDYRKVAYLKYKSLKQGILYSKLVPFFSKVSSIAKLA